MKKYLLAFAVAVSAGIATIALQADENEAEDRGGYGEHDPGMVTRLGPEGSPNGPAYSYMRDPQHGLYKDECGACHFAFPPSLLPAASWQRLMTSLNAHFGENAELDAATAQKISAYLDQYSAGKAPGDYSERMWRATRGRAPLLRITDTDYFRGQHHEIPAKMVADNPEVKSFGRCEVCHRGAEQGSFDERQVRIPGYGRFND